MTLILTNFLLFQFLISLYQIKYLKNKPCYGLALVISSLHKYKNLISDKKSYVSFIISHKEKITYTSIFFKLVVVKDTLLDITKLS